LALALLLSMAVMASPVGAAISNVTVTVTNPLGGAVGDYTVSFVMQQPLDSAVFVPPLGEYIDIGFPAGTDLTGITEITVVGTDSIAAAVTYTLTGGDLGMWTVGNTLRIYLTGLVAPGDLAAGAVTVTVEDVGHPEPCYHTLTVGTSQETAVTSPQYKIYLFEVTLVPGWNLISLPGIPENTDIEVVLADLLPPTCVPGHDFQVWYWDCGQWYVYCYDTVYETLTTMDECKSYWIYIDRAASFKVKGVWYPPPPGPPLKKCYHECWNMVGFTSPTPMVPDDYMATMAPAGAAFYVMTYVGGAWQVLDMALDNMNPGQGYWVAFSLDACFAPPPP